MPIWAVFAQPTQAGSPPLGVAFPLNSWGCEDPVGAPRRLLCCPLRGPEPRGPLLPSFRVEGEWAPGPSPWAELTPCLGSPQEVLIAQQGWGRGPRVYFTFDYRDLVSVTFIFVKIKEVIVILM